MDRTVLVVVGTRPEAIKMAPVVRELQRRPGIQVKVCLTAQHREMLDQVVRLFSLPVDVDLDVMAKGQDLNGLTARLLERLGEVMRAVRPQFVLVHGDTTTTFAATLAAFYAGARVGHVEAGLRTGNLRAPWPEEANRRLTAVLAEAHFAPTDSARLNLLSEGIDSSAIFVTGNTVIDALLGVVDLLAKDEDLRTTCEQRLPFLSDGRKMVLVTGHRRESFGAGFESMCRALARLAERDDVIVVYPVHLNPNVRQPVLRILGGRRNVHLLEPVEYLDFVFLMSRSAVIVTDSGGIQEEAPSLGKRVIVTRELTERPEAVSAGVARLVGTDEAKIVAAVSEALEDARPTMIAGSAVNPYGDGRAAERIADILVDFL